MRLAAVPPILSTPALMRPRPSGTLKVEGSTLPLANTAHANDNMGDQQIQQQIGALPAATPVNSLATKASGAKTRMWRSPRPSHSAISDSTLDLCPSRERLRRNTVTARETTRPPK
jgi:hypothetical protein